MANFPRGGAQYREKRSKPKTEWAVILLLAAGTRKQAAGCVFLAAAVAYLELAEQPIQPRRGLRHREIMASNETSMHKQADCR